VQVAGVGIPVLLLVHQLVQHGSSAVSFLTVSPAASSPLYSGCSSSSWCSGGPGQLLSRGNALYMVLLAT
jgi:hypothetical protein